MGLIDQLDSITIQANQNFSALNPEQLNWKPAPEKWGIAQCLDHLIISNSDYFPAFDQLLKGGYHPTRWQRINPLSGYVGKMMVKMLGPVPKKKFKAPKIFMPSSSNIHSGILKQFEQHQQQLKTFYSRLQRLDGNQIIISSPVSKLITYSLQHVLELLAGHEQRHINQALTVLHHPNFPKLIT